MTSIIGMRVDVITYEAATASILGWCLAPQSRYVCIANAHDLMTAYDAADFRDALNQADLVTPDGMPLVWIFRLRGYPISERVYGPALMQWLLDAAVREGVPIGLYGSTEGVLDLLAKRLAAQWPNLEIPYSYSPPFRELTCDEDESVCRAINESGARILFVGIGSPKQVRWMAAHRGRISAVMVGVGAAFDFLAGAKKQAPSWMQSRGLEWLYRLIQEPRRLWKRYLIQNTRFAALAIAELLGLWRPDV